MTDLTRRKLLRSVPLVGLAGCISRTEDGSSSDNGSDTDANEEGITVEKVTDGFTSPVGLSFVDDRIFVVDQVGQIYSHELGSNSDPSVFLDISDRTVDIGGYSERGVLGLAFHPDFDENNRFYVRYSSPSLEGTPDDYSHTEVLSEFEAKSLKNADPDSERVLMKLPQPQSNHNAGAIAFGPDDMLYIATGDGGGAGDRGKGHVEDWYDKNDGGNGQDVTENLLGSILRIDVDDTEGDKEYGIPDDNPLVGEDGLDEHYAWGLRNPWRMSFNDGDLYVADVGQNEYEEVNIIEKGGNYGWNVKEATHCFDANECPDETPDGKELIDPVTEYPQTRDGEQIGRAVIAGYLYDGEVPELQGKYIFGDWSGSFSGGENMIFTTEPSENETAGINRVALEDSESLGNYLLAFGRDVSGELYVATTDNASVEGTRGESTNS